MRIENDGAYIDLVPVAYEFPDAEGGGKDVYDANWIVLRIEYSDGRERSGTETEAILLTYEMIEFADQLKRTSAGLSDSAELRPIEPFFAMSAAKSGDAFELTVSFIPGPVSTEPVKVTRSFPPDEFDLLIAQIEEEYKPFPVR